MRLKKQYQKYKDMIFYGVFGLLTTAVNILTYWVMSHPMKMSTGWSTVVAWALAVLFAYVTNRKWVFHSNADSRAKVAKEITSFFGCRLVTGMIDWSLMFICVELMLWDDMMVKIVTNVIVIILNYIFSKLLVFGDKRVS